MIVHAYMHLGGRAEESEVLGQPGLEETLSERRRDQAIIGGGEMASLVKCLVDKNEDLSLIV